MQINMANDTKKWDTIYRQRSNKLQLGAARVLADFQHLLPSSGIALDLAAGRGANAFLLAQHGLQTHAWDISAVAIEQLQRASQDLNIHTQVRDVVALPPAENTFDVIVVSHFLHRQLIPSLIQSLRVNGLLFYQTFIRDVVQDSPPHNPEYRLRPNELLFLCQDLRLIVYREEGTIGDTSSGFRNQAMLIGQRNV